MTHFIEAQTKYLENKGYTVFINYECVVVDSDGWFRVLENKFINVAYKPETLPHVFDFTNYEDCLDYLLERVFRTEFIKEMSNE